MEDKIKAVIGILHQKGINYTIKYHEPVYTIEDMERLDLDKDGTIPKNLFLRDNKKTRFYLAVLPKEKRADLKSLGQKLSSPPLSFASEKYLEKYLGLAKGAVSPLGILNDKEGAVTVVFDQDLEKVETIGIHPNQNTATVFMSISHLVTLIKANGNQVIFLEM